MLRKNRLTKTQFKQTLAIFMASLSVAADFSAGQKIRLTGRWNARTSSNFSKNTGNVLYTIPADTWAEILSADYKPATGNYGLQIKITSDLVVGNKQRKNETVWIYYSRKNPSVVCFDESDKEKSCVDAAKLVTQKPTEAHRSTASLEASNPSPQKNKTTTLADEILAKDPRCTKTRGALKNTENRYDSLIAELTHGTGVDPALVKALLVAESGLNPLAHGRLVNRKRAKGMGQFFPAAASEENLTHDITPPKGCVAGDKNPSEECLQKLNYGGDYCGKPGDGRKSHPVYCPYWAIKGVVGYLMKSRDYRDTRKDIFSNGRHFSDYFDAMDPERQMELKGYQVAMFHAGRGGITNKADAMCKNSSCENLSVPPIKQLWTHFSSSLGAENLCHIHQVVGLGDNNTPSLYSKFKSDFNILEKRQEVQLAEGRK